MVLLLAALSPLFAADVVEVDAAVLITLATDYRGQRVRTELSKVAVVGGPAAGCTGREIGIVLGPKLRMGEAPAVTSRQVALCVARDASAPLVALPMGTGILFEADVRPSGIGGNGPLLLTNATLVGTVDRTTGAITPQP